MAPGPEDPLKDPSGKLLEEFARALVSAFPSWEKLRAFAEASDLVHRMRAEIGDATGTYQAARDLLEELEAKGALRKALTAALKRQPENPALKRFRQKSARWRRFRSPHSTRPASKASTCAPRRASGAPPSAWRASGSASSFSSRATSIREVLQPLVKRPCRFILENTGNAVHSSTNVTLRPDLATLEDAIGRVERVKQSLATQPVLIRVLCREGARS